MGRLTWMGWIGACVLAHAGCRPPMPSADRMPVGTPRASSAAASATTTERAVGASRPSDLTSRTIPPPSTPDPFAARGAPARLEIPSIGVDTDIESLSFTSEGKIDVPKEWDEAGWYRASARPGEPGRALISGHLDDDHGRPAVFWDLDKLAAGDEVRVTYTNADRYTFVVVDHLLVDGDVENSATLDRIFGPSDVPRLNLITCDGAWDRGAASYTKRLVVFTQLSPNADIAPTRPLAPSDDN